MKTEVRLLPRLDQLYTQKKSYQVHKKKINEIKLSRSLSKKSLTLSKVNDNQQDAKSIKSLIYQHMHQQESSFRQNDIEPPMQKHMQTIQQAKPGLSYWLKKMNPHQKRLKQEQIKENKRIRQKIKNTMSFIVQKNQLSDHSKHYSGMKKMLSRFSVQQNSQKTKLKCEIVLKKLSDVEKQKLKLQESRLMSFEKLQSPNTLQKRMIPPVDEKDRLSSFLTRRSKILSQKIKVFNKQSISNVKDHSIKRPNQTSFTREKMSFQSKTNEMRTSSTMKNQIPNVNRNSLRYNRVKTQLIERTSTNRLFNNSKLSDLSEDSTGPKINLSDYKMVKVNFHHAGPKSLKRVSSLKQTPFEKPQNSIMTVKNKMQLKKYVSDRIKTQNSSFANLISKKQGQNKLDYKKKRIQRYFISKTSLNIKQSTNKSRQPRNQTYQKQYQQIKVRKENGAIIEENHESKLATIQIESEQKDLEIMRNETKKKEQESPQVCFATQVQ